jgi:two-component system, NarL family, nitrate/nitrite response regulator NarL
VKRSIPTVIIEPRTVLREGLASLLHGSNFKVTASVASVDELPDRSPGHARVVILGLAKAAPDDLQLLDTLSHAPRDYKIVAIVEASGPSAQVDIAQVLRSGADGYISNIHSRDVLLKSLELTLLGQRLVVLGDNYGPAETSESATDQTSSGDGPGRNNGNTTAPPGLSDRELEILACLAAGDSNKLIARACRIAESTVKIHLKSILRKIHAQNRTQAAIWAIQNHLIGFAESPPLATVELSQPEMPAAFVTPDLCRSKWD